MSSSLGSGTLCGWALEGGFALADDALASAGGCVRLTAGSGKSELAGACAKFETAVVPLVEVLCVTLGVKEALAAIAEVVLGLPDALDDPCNTGPTASSESAAKGLVESNEADVGLLGVACVVPSVPDVAEADDGAEAADAKGSDVALEVPAADGPETAEGVPWLLAEALPPAPAELYPVD